MYGIYVACGFFTSGNTESLQFPRPAAFFCLPVTVGFFTVFIKRPQDGELSNERQALTTALPAPVVIGCCSHSPGRPTEWRQTRPAFNERDPSCRITRRLLSRPDLAGTRHAPSTITAASSCACTSSGDVVIDVRRANPEQTTQSVDWATQQRGTGHYRKSARGRRDAPVAKRREILALRRSTALPGSQ